MKELVIKNINGINVTDSRNVAEMIGKEHKHLMRDIRGYINVLSTSPNLDPLNFFIEDSYLDSKNETRPCYLLTKQGCEMVANKMTGEKGILFTAEYVQAFNQMEDIIKSKKPSLSNNDIMIALEEILKEHDLMRKELEEKTNIINKLNKCISNGGRLKQELTEDEFRDLIVEFMNENDVILKVHRNGLVIDKEALYKYMAQYGWTQHEVLETLDRYNMVYHSQEDRTQRIKLNGRMVKVIIIQ